MTRAAIRAVMSYPPPGLFGTIMRVADTVSVPGADDPQALTVRSSATAAALAYLDSVILLLTSLWCPPALDGVATIKE
jgi:hypothetical protein